VNGLVLNEKKKRKKTYSAAHTTTRVVQYTLLTIGALIMLMPLFWMIMTSFDKTANTKLPFPPRLFPKQFANNNYVVAFTNVPLLMYFYNTGIFTLINMCVMLFGAITGGYAFSKINFPFKRTLLLLCLATMMVPFEMLVIPLWDLFRRMSLLDTLVALVLPSMGWVWGMFLAKQFMDTLPNTLREAAKIDGAGEVHIFLRIYLVLSKPIIATLAIFSFVSSWNSFLWPLIVLNNSKKYLIQIGIALFAQNPERVYPGMILAATTISIIPVAAVFLVLQKYIVESIAITGLKA